MSIFQNKIIGQKLNRIAGLDNLDRTAKRYLSDLQQVASIERVDNDIISKLMVVLNNARRVSDPAKLLQHEKVKAESSIILYELADYLFSEGRYAEVVAVQDIIEDFQFNKNEIKELTYILDIRLKPLVDVLAEKEDKVPDLSLVAINDEDVHLKSNPDPSTTPLHKKGILNALKNSVWSEYTASVQGVMKSLQLVLKESQRYNLLKHDSLAVQYTEVVYQIFAKYLLSNHFDKYAKRSNLLVIINELNEHNLPHDDLVIAEMLYNYLLEKPEESDIYTLSPEDLDIELKINSFKKYLDLAIPGADQNHQTIRSLYANEYLVKPLINIAARLEKVTKFDTNLYTRYNNEISDIIKRAHKYEANGDVNYKLYLRDGVIRNAFDRYLREDLSLSVKHALGYVNTLLEWIRVEKLIVSGTIDEAVDYGEVLAGILNSHSEKYNNYDYSSVIERYLSGAFKDFWKELFHDIETVEDSIIVDGVANEQSGQEDSSQDNNENIPTAKERKKKKDSGLKEL